MAHRRPEVVRPKQLFMRRDLRAAARLRNRVDEIESISSNQPSTSSIVRDVSCGWQY
jgi:hypothetical protein